MSPNDRSDKQPSSRWPDRLKRTLFFTSRPVSWINTAFPFGAAYLLAGGGLTLDFWLGVLFFLIPYNLAMYGINDVFDYESDRLNPRKGGVQGALLHPDYHQPVFVAIGILLLPFLAYFSGRTIATGNWPAEAVLAFSMFMVVAYSIKGLRFKEIPILDALTSSVHFSSPAWFALALLGSWPSRDGLLVLIAFFLWGMASQAFGAVQDILPDRHAGISSIATALGARGTVWFAVILYLAADVLVWLTRWPIWLGAALVLPYLVNTVRYAGLRDEDSAQAQSGWKLFIPLNYAVGFCVTMLMIWYVRS